MLAQELSGELKKRWTDWVSDYLGKELLGKEQSNMWQITCNDNNENSHAYCVGIKSFATNHITGNRF